MMVYWNWNVITATSFHIKCLTLDYFDFPIFLHIVGFFSVIYLYTYIYVWVCACVLWVT